MATVTSPIITDSTGQDIVDGLTALAGAVRPSAGDIPYDANTTVKGKIDNITTEAQLTISRIENSYFNDEVIQRNVVKTCNNVKCVIVNLQNTSAAIPVISGFIDIFKINNFSINNTCYQCVISQSNTNQNAVLQLTTNGTMRLHTDTGLSLNNFIRCTITVI